MLNLPAVSVKIQGNEVSAEGVFHDRVFPAAGSSKPVVTIGKPFRIHAIIKQ
jgi:hypothetical protein